MVTMVFTMRWELAVAKQLLQKDGEKASKSPMYELKQQCEGIMLA